MNRRQILLLASGLAIVLALTAWLVLRSGDAPPEEVPDDSSLEVVVEGERETVELYFIASGAVLRKEPREIDLGVDVRSRAVLVLGSLLAGPETESLYPVLASEIRLLGVDIQGRVAFVDLGHEELVAPPDLGSRGELLTVYALVNSIALNLDEIDSVVLLWNGIQRVTFSGHIDTTRALLPKSTLVAG